LVEAAAQANSPINIKPFEGWVDLFIVPGYRFQIVDALITNFHLPRSTLLMLVTAFAGKELIDKTYQEAIKERYRFYSFGDAMLIL
jgi:S-adenosylmethionine:tRNA ribosyltransferase-isomerase